MSAHTPGPWVVWEGHAEVFAGPAKSNTPGMIRGTRGIVANCESDDFGENEDEQEANARLIAAAPDLLEALRCLLSGVPGAEVTARAAIAKAEGKS